MSLVTDILQTCAASPQPWHPREFVRGRSEPVEDITFCFNALCQADVLKLVGGENQQAAGFALTPHGAELARDPEAIARFADAEGLVFSPRDSAQGQAIRRTLENPGRPRLNHFFLAANCLVFGVGILLAATRGIPGRPGVAGTLQAAWRFIWPFTVQGGKLGIPEDVRQIVHETGANSCGSFLAGEWWRLLTSGFVHISILHLLMNMYALRILGSDTEWLWGMPRYGVLYFTALLGGSCAGLLSVGAMGTAEMAFRAPQAGASGAVCGLLAAEAVWVVLNRRFLPRRLVRRQLRALFVNSAIILAISLAPGVSGAGHLGGAVVGLVVALLLHWHRFGSGVVRVLALLVLVAVPLGCLIGVQQVSQRDPTWLQLRGIRERKFIAELREQQRQAQSEMATLHKDQLLPLLESKVNRRDPVRVGQAVEKLDELIVRFRHIADETARLPASKNLAVEEFREASQDYFQRRAVLSVRIRSALRDGMDWNPQEEAEDELIAAQRRWHAAFNALR